MDDDDEMDEREAEPRALPEVTVDAGPCCICGKAEQVHGCFRCGRPVCMHPEQYMEDSSCGSWILDWWHDSAFDLDDGNAFWCRACLKKVYGNG